jgi:putative RecB family exonuclease
MIEDTSTKFSPSKLATYRECPQRYKLRYIDGVKREGQTVEQYLGTCVHGAFEDLYASAQKGRTLTEPETVAAFESRWLKDVAAVLPGHDGPPDAQAWSNLGRESVRNYYRQYAPFDQDRTVGIERRVGFPLEVGGETYRLEGFVDRLAISKADESFEIHDYKTAKTLPTQEYVDKDWQLGLYEIAIRTMWPDTKSVRLKWHYVRHGKTLTSTRTREQLEALRAEARGVIEEIKKDHVFEPRESPLCGWCEFRALCPLFAHAEKVSALPVELRGVDEGRAAVDQLGAIDERKRALRAQLRQLEVEQEELSQRLLEFARKNGYQAVAGSNVEAVAATKEKLEFPTKTHSPEKLAELEKTLKESSLWSAVSHFDAHRFVEAWKARDWPAEWQRLADAIVERYAQRSVETALRLRRRRDADDSAG